MREIEDPELASERIRSIYRAKGYSDAWIEKRSIKVGATTSETRKLTC